MYVAKIPFSFSSTSLVINQETGEWSLFFIKLDTYMDTRHDTYTGKIKQKLKTEIITWISAIHGPRMIQGWLGTAISLLPLVRPTC